MSLKHIHLLAEDDDDPMLSAVNLVDVFLVLVVALLTAVAAQSSSVTAEDRVTIIKNAGSPDMEVIVRENGQEVKFKGVGQAGAGQGERAGVAYKLKDGQIVYVPEPAGSRSSGAAVGAP
ncbi:DUF2149 domain-containing protein [Aquabacterium sp. G14]|uniref:DUF2149 domain-containing protein n=1 Tax=Aquabacterium sp. G14 TaxID=3130164 RepID=UPI0030A5E8E9